MKSFNKLTVKDVKKERKQSKELRQLRMQNGNVNLLGKSGDTKSVVTFCQEAHIIHLAHFDECWDYE